MALDTDPYKTQHWMSPTEAANRYGVSPATVRNWIRKHPGQVTELKLGRCKLYRISEFDKLELTISGISC